MDNGILATMRLAFCFAPGMENSQGGLSGQKGQA